MGRDDRRQFTHDVFDVQMAKTCVADGNRPGSLVSFWVFFSDQLKYFLVSSLLVWSPEKGAQKQNWDGRFHGGAGLRLLPPHL